MYAVCGGGEDCGCAYFWGTARGGWAGGGLLRRVHIGLLPRYTALAVVVAEAEAAAPKRSVRMGLTRREIAYSLKEDYN